MSTLIKGGTVVTADMTCAAAPAFSRRDPARSAVANTPFRVMIETAEIVE